MAKEAEQDTTEPETEEVQEAEAEEASVIEIPAEIENSEIHTAASPFETLNAKLDLLLKAQNIKFEGD